MCWISKKEPVQYIAESRIPVYKIMLVGRVTSKILRSYYRQAMYNLNTNYVSDLATPEECIDRITLKPRYCIDIGLHSYSTSNTVCLKRASHLMVVSKKTKELLDSYPIPYPTALQIITSLAKVSGYIPVDARYYINEHGEYVSNEIVLTDIEEYTGDKNHVLEV